MNNSENYSMDVNKSENHTISNIIYLVDLENVGTKLLYEHINHHENMKYIVFYSDSTSAPDTILRNISLSVQIKFVDCKTGGNNAMDFCISAMAGRLAANLHNNIRILSNDKGYDPMIRMLQEYGIRIRRETITYEPVNVSDKTSKETKSSQPDELISDATLIYAIKHNVPIQYQNKVANALSEVINRKEAHEILQSILPQKVATDIYRKIRKYIPKEVI